MSTLPAIQLANIAIRQDADGRYCLNDLHRSAGEEARHRPATWLQNQQTTELIQECEKDGIPSIVAKQGVGTFVVKELVYAYAMWISPAFHLQVIRTFDKVAAQATPAPTMLMTPAAIAASTIREVMSIAAEFGRSPVWAA